MSQTIRRFAAFLSALAFTSALLAAPATQPTASSPEDIEGVQPAALDQPRIYLQLHRTTTDAPLKTTDADGAISAIEAFLDTGASGVMLSKDTVSRLKIATAKDVTYEDVGVGGSEKFGVTEPLRLAIASYPHDEPENADFNTPLTLPLRMQIKEEGGLIDLIAPGMDIAGTPIMRNKVIVMNPVPLKDYDKIHTQLLAPGDKSIPKTSRHVPLTMVSFASFTRVTPKGASGPELSANPMIGPNPLTHRPTTQPASMQPTDDVVIVYHGKTAHGTFLLDTGAAASVISTKMAEQLDIDIDKVPAKEKFELAIGGLGGSKDAKGLFVDRLELPTKQLKPIVYLKAPFLISDITVADESGKTFTLDGVFGMNYLVDSAEITGGLLPDVGKIVQGPWKMIVVDFQKNVLGLEPR